MAYIMRAAEMSLWSAWHVLRSRWPFPCIDRCAQEPRVLPRLRGIHPQLRKGRFKWLGLLQSGGNEGLSVGQNRRQSSRAVLIRWTSCNDRDSELENALPPRPTDRTRGARAIVHRSWHPCAPLSSRATGHSSGCPTLSQRHSNLLSARPRGMNLRAPTRRRLGSHSVLIGEWMPRMAECGSCE